MKKNVYPKLNKTYINNKIQVKEYFILINHYLRKYSNKISLIDIGCASGDFIFTL